MSRHRHRTSASYRLVHFTIAGAFSIGMGLALGTHTPQRHRLPEVRVEVERPGDLKTALRDAARRAAEGAGQARQIGLFGTVTAVDDATVTIREADAPILGKHVTLEDGLVERPPRVISTTRHTRYAGMSRPQIGEAVFVGAARRGDTFEALDIASVRGATPVAPHGLAEHGTHTTRPLASSPNRTATGESERLRMASAPFCANESNVALPPDVQEFKGCMGGPSLSEAFTFGPVKFIDFGPELYLALKGFHFEAASAGYAYDFPFQFSVAPGTPEAGDTAVGIGTRGPVDVMVSPVAPEPKPSFFGGFGASLGFVFEFRHAGGTETYDWTLPAPFSTLVRSTAAPPASGPGQEPLLIDTTACPTVEVGIPGPLGEAADKLLVAPPLFEFQSCNPLKLYGAPFTADVYADGKDGVVKQRLSFDGVNPSTMRFTPPADREKVKFAFTNFDYQPIGEQFFRFHISLLGTEVYQSDLVSNKEIPGTYGRMQAITTPFPLYDSAGQSDFSGSQPDVVTRELKLRPGIASVTPPKVSIAGGERIVIRGGGFSKVTGVVLKRRTAPTGRVDVPYRVVSDNVIEATVPRQESQAISTVHLLLPCTAGETQCNRFTSEAWIGPGDHDVIPRLDLEAFPTTAKVTTSANPVQAGDPLVLRAEVVGRPDDNEVPTGVVTFYDGPRAIGAPVPLTGGRAELKTSYTGVDVSTHSLTARYSGSPRMQATTSPPLYQGVVRRTARIGLSARPNQDRTVVLTATVPDVGNAPDNLVSFLFGGRGHDATLTDGVAHLTTSPLPPGQHRFEASFNGGRDYESVSSNPVEIVVDDTGSRLLTRIGDVTSVPPANVRGESVTFTAATDQIPNGSRVEIQEGGGASGSSGKLIAAGTVANGQVRITTPYSADVGKQVLTAVYGGDGQHLGTSSAPLIQQVLGNPTSFELAGSSTVHFPDPVKLTAVVASGQAGDLGGTIVFDLGAVRLSETAFGASDAPSTRFAATKDFPLPAGRHVITARYSGNHHYAPSSEEITVIVEKARTDVLLAAENDLTQRRAATPVTFTAVIRRGTGTMTFEFSGAENASHTVPVVEGRAVFTHPGFSRVGDVTISALYSGDASVAAASTGALKLKVEPIETTSRIAAESPTVYGRPFALTAKVDTGNAARAAAGEVTFYDAGVAIGTGALDDLGQATIYPTTLRAGAHLLTVQYHGAGLFHGSASPPLTHIVQQASARPDIRTYPAAGPIDYGQGVSVAVSLPSNATGSISLFDGDRMVDHEAVNNGQAYLFTIPSGGDHVFEVRYSGDTNYVAASRPLAMTVRPTPTSIRLEASAPSVIFGEDLRLTATLSGAPMGAPVVFSDGDRPVGTVASRDGVAVFVPTTELGAGPHRMSARYAGDVNSLAASSSPIDVTIRQAPTELTLSTPSDPARFAAVVLDATLPARVTGTVDFFVERDGTTTPLASVPPDKGVARLKPALAVGRHVVRANYRGDPNHVGSSAGPLTITVEKGLPTVAISPDANPVASGAATTLRIGVAREATGDVSLVDITMGRSEHLATTTLSEGSASFRLPGRPRGSYTYRIDYAGDPNFEPGTDSFGQAVKDPSSTTLRTGVNPATYGESLPLVATVSAVDAVTGRVVFRDGTVVLGAADVAADGQATLEVASLAAGDHALDATYQGDANHLSSIATASQAVARATPEARIAADVNPSVHAQALTLTVDLPDAASGTVEFLETTSGDKRFLGSAPVTDGRASLPVAPLAVGRHQLDANYQGDRNHSPATARHIQDVRRASSDLVAESLQNPQLARAGVDLVAFLPADATGSVTFSGYDHGSLRAFGSAALEPSSYRSSAARFTIHDLPAGDHRITITYPGDARYLPSEASLTQSVDRLPSTVDVDVPDTKPYGEPVTLTARLPQHATGTVVFSHDYEPVATAPVEDGVAVATLPAVTGGTHFVSAVYAGDDAFLPANSPQVHYQVARAPTVIALGSDPNPAPRGQPVTLAVRLPGPATGRVEFFTVVEAVRRSLGFAGVTDGKATLEVSSPEPGQHRFAAEYSGDLSHAPASVEVVHEAERLAAAMTLTSSRNPSSYGQVPEFTIRLPLSDVRGPSGQRYQPTGDVTLRVDNKTVLTAPLVQEQGTDNVYLFAGGVPLAPGEHVVVASYPGDAHFAADTATLTQAVTRQETGLSLGGDDVIYGQPTELRAVIERSRTGTITFSRGDTVLSTLTLDGSGQTRLTVPGLPAGIHRFVASYSGDDLYAPAEGTAVVTVARRYSPLTLLSDPARSAEGEDVDIVLQADPDATGQVEFFEGIRSLGQADLQRGSATITVSGLSSGRHSIEASYPGDGNIRVDPQRPETTHVVVAGASVVRLSSEPNPSDEGTDVFLIARLESLEPTEGEIVFLRTDGGSAVELGRAPLVLNTATLRLRDLPAGTYQFIADYPYGATSRILHHTVRPVERSQ
jgi:hypothetical protein